MDWVLRIIIGLVISLGLGALITPMLLCCIRETIKKKGRKLEGMTEDEYEKFFGVPYIRPCVLGTIERLFFTIVVAFNVSGTATAMIGWIAVKMATDWQIIVKDDKDNRKSWKRQLAMSGLLGSMISLFFALIGGLVLRYWNCIKSILSCG